jgi:RNA polymerase sigma-70 factor (ECF subfamily)
MQLLTNCTTTGGHFFCLFLIRLGFLKKISPTSFTDSELVAQYRTTGSLKVLGDLYNRYMDMLYGVCLKYLKEPEEAQDAVMAIFEELIPKLKQHEIQNFKSWVYTLAKNHCLMKLRQQKKLPTTKMEDGFMQSEADEHLKDVLDREEHFRQLDECMEQLVDGQRKVIELFYLQGKCYNEISAETGLEWSSVRSFIQNGRRNLKLCMEGQKRKISANE